MMKVDEYRQSFYNYYQYIGKNPRYAKTFAHKMNKLSKLNKNETI